MFVKQCINKFKALIVVILNTTSFQSVLKKLLSIYILLCNFFQLFSENKSSIVTVKWLQTKLKEPTNQRGENYCEKVVEMFIYQK